MPTYTVLLAHDITYYGNVSVEGDTWQEAVASLTSFDWDECYEQGDGAWEQRVVHVEAEDGGGIVAEDIAYNKHMVYRENIIHHLTVIRDTLGLSHEATAAVTAFIEELRTMGQDPIFNKKDTSK
jgi:hypothetical protein